MDDNKMWMDLIQMIQQIVPVGVSLLLITVPYLIELTISFENGLMPKEKKNEQKSMPGEFLALITTVLTVFVVGVGVNYNSGNMIFLRAVREWLNKPGGQWEYYTIVFVFLCIGCLWHFLKLKYPNAKIKNLLMKIPLLGIVIRSVCNYFKTREHDHIGDYSRLWNRRLQLKEPYFEYNDSYILKDSYVQVRLLNGLLCCFFWFLAAFYPRLRAFSLLSELIDIWGGGKLVQIAICTIGFYFYECYSYYNGYTWDEYKRKELNQQTETDQKELLDLHAVAAGEQETNAKFCIFSEVVGYNRNIDIIRGKGLVETFNSSDDYHKRCIGRMWADLLNMRPEEIDTDFMSAAIQLAEHRSVYFATPFYRDAGPYIFPFLSLELLENKKILVVSGAVEDGARLKSWFKEGLQSKYGYLEFWDVETMLEGIGTADIGIATMGEIAELATTEFASDFLKNVSVVLLLEPSFFISFQPVMMPLILAKIRRSQEKITYIVCDMNITGMVDLLSDTLKESFIFVKATAKSAVAEHTVLDVDCVDESNPFKNIELCCENELWQALATGERFATKIQWYGEQSIPVWDIRWRLGIYDNLSAVQDETKDVFHDMIEHLEFYETGSLMRREERASSFVEDSIYNASELLRQYESRGYLESQTSVFSPNYLMRDFMMTDDRQGISPITQITPRFQNSFGNMAIAIAYSLTKGNVSEEELEWLLNYYNYDLKRPTDWEGLIERLNSHYEKLTGRDMTLSAHYTNQQGNGRRSCKSLYYMTTAARESFLDWYKQNIEVICFQNEELIRQENILNSMPGGHIYQYYLPKQFLVVAGKYYQIDKIGERNGRKEVKLSRAAEFCTVRRYYRQCRRYCISDMQNLVYQAYPGGKAIKLHMAEVNLRVATESYISSEKFQEWNESDFIKVNGIPERSYIGKKILLIQVDRECVCVLAVFLKELFFTLFPNSWQLLSVALTENSGLEGRVDCIDIQEQEPDSKIYIIEDSPLDLGLLDTIGIWFIHILSIFDRYADWLIKEEKSSKKWKTRWERLAETVGTEFDFSEVKKKLEL